LSKKLLRSESIVTKLDKQVAPQCIEDSRGL